MLYLFYGKDTLRSLDKLKTLIQSLLKGKEKNAPLFEINEENFDESYLKGLIYSSHLFGNKNLVVLKRVFENEKISDYFVGRLAELNKSPHIFP